MPDDMSPLFSSSWGDIRLFVSSFRWASGNTVTVHNLAAGDLHPAVPRGAHNRVAVLQLMFDDFPGIPDSGIVAFRRFEAVSKERRLFTHPVDGTYFALIGELEVSVDSNSVVTASCEFIPDGEVQPVAPAGAGTSSIAGEGSVLAAADVLVSSLADLGIGMPATVVPKMDFSRPIGVNMGAAFAVSLDADVSFSANISVGASLTASTSVLATASVLAFATAHASALAQAGVTSVASDSGMPSGGAFAFAFACAAVDADARASAAVWGQGADIRRIIADVARLAQSVGDMIDSGGFEDDIALWPAFRAAILLGDAVVSAAVAATADASSLFIMRVREPTALLPLAARVYGGREAQDRADEIMRLNDISTPGWMPPGDYLMPARPSSAPMLIGL